MVSARGCIIPACALMILSAAAPHAELATTAEITGTAAVYSDGEGSAGALSYGTAGLNLRSAGDPNVRGELELKATVADRAVVEVPRAYIKVRFPGFRLTLGKTRVTWGEGFLFNAGDVVFEGISLPGDLSEAELRDETDWMIVPYLPLGPFSFIEGVVLPHPRLDEGSEAPVPLDVQQLDAGSRIAARLLETKMEAGYLYRGSTNEHRPYISLQRNLLSLEWQLSSSLSVPFDSPEAEDVRESWDLSVGFFRYLTLERGGSLLFRLESAIRPFAGWVEKDHGSTDSAYGLYLYPEIAYSPRESMTAYLRSVLSPVDLSALTFAGYRWNIYQGFTMHFYAFVMGGDENDHFGWNRAGDLGLGAELRFVYGGRS